METITFYSYKGGTGRSLAVAQLAVILARFGKSVFVIDFDIEAPGLELKFRSVADIPDFEFGLVNYIEEYRKQKRIRSLKNAIIPIEPRTTKIRGVINLLPAGNAFRPDFAYWYLISHPDFQDFISSDGAIKEFFPELKAQIAEEFKPDYLLLDSRSGVNELGGICTRVLADTVVFLSAYNPEELGTNIILKSYETAREAEKDAPANSYFVISRVPSYYVDEQGKFQRVPEETLEEIIRDVDNTINRRLKQNSRIIPIYNFRSEPTIQLNEHLLITFDKNKDRTNNLLAKGYIEFFSDLIPEIRSDLRKLLREVQIYRPFMLVEDKGTLVNPEDGQPNVAFRVDTFLTMFNSMYHSAYEREKKNIFEREKEKLSNEQAKKTAEERANIIASEELFKAGEDASKEFSKFLRTDWATEMEKVTLTPTFKSKLDKWCKFDSTVGFGKFENETWGVGKKGKIKIINNFLIYERSKNKHNLCSFMRGYISCVLNAIFAPESVNVYHNLDEDCGQYQDTDHRICVFPFEVSEKKDTVKRQSIW